ncbi:MAG: hypothetical protein KJ667_07065 [Alphaproteobacteria bacterium]|nr:hypothetical protein [Alphaproteobacteria bacterium]
MAVVTCAAVLFTGVVPAPAWSNAESAMTIRNNDDVTVTGEVITVTKDKMTLNTGSSEVDIDMAGLTLDTRVDGFIQPGMTVTVNGALTPGTFNTPIIAARQLSIQSSND